MNNILARGCLDRQGVCRVEPWSRAWTRSSPVPTQLSCRPRLKGTEQKLTGRKKGPSRGTLRGFGGRKPRQLSATVKAMVNVDFANPSMILGSGLMVCGGVLLQMRTWQSKTSKDSDIVIAAMISIVGSTLIFQGWRLDPLLLLCQVLTTSVALFYGVETFRLRSQFEDQQVPRSEGINTEEAVAGSAQQQETEQTQQQQFEQQQFQQQQFLQQQFPWRGSQQPPPSMYLPYPMSDRAYPWQGSEGYMGGMASMDPRNEMDTSMRASNYASVSYDPVDDVRSPQLGRLTYPAEYPSEADRYPSPYDSGRGPGMGYEEPPESTSYAPSTSSWGIPTQMNGQLGNVGGPEEVVGYESRSIELPGSGVPWGVTPEARGGVERGSQPGEEWGQSSVVLGRPQPVNEPIDDWE